MLREERRMILGEIDSQLGNGIKSEKGQIYTNISIFSIDIIKIFKSLICHLSDLQKNMEVVLGSHHHCNQSHFAWSSV